MVKNGESIRLAEASDWVTLENLLLKDETQAQQTDSYGMLPIHWASTEGNVPLSVLKSLIKAYPGGVKVRNHACLLPIHISARAKASIEWMKILLDHYPESIAEKTPCGQTPAGLSEKSGASMEEIEYLSRREDAYLATVVKSDSNQLGQSPPKPLPAPLTLGRQTSAPMAKSGSARKISIGKKSSNLFLRHHQHLQPTRKPNLVRQQSAPVVTNHDYDDVSSVEDDVEMKSREQSTAEEVFELPPPWANDTACYICRSSFNVFRHRHHCRNCGKSICREHSGGKIEMPTKGFTAVQRACVICISTLRSGDRAFSISNQSDTNSYADESRAGSAHRMTRLTDLESAGDLDSFTSRGRKSTSPDDEEIHEYRDKDTIPRTPSMEVDELREQVRELQNQVKTLIQSKMAVQHQLLEQEEVQAKTMLLLTETMTRVSVLELQNEDNEL